MLEREYQQCNRCVMDTSDPDIVFDQNGVCNHCTEFFDHISKQVYQGLESDVKLEKLIEKVKQKGTNKKYDCIIGVSGGVDSIYLSYLAKQWGLNPLAVHMDNGWDSKIAVLNIKKAMDKIGIDLYTYVLDWEEFKDLQLSFLKASVPEVENPTDMGIPGVLHRVAVKYKIKYILSGGNYATEGILPKSYQYNPKDLKYLQNIQKTFGNLKLVDFPKFGYFQESYYKVVNGIKILYPLNLIPFNKKDAVEFLKTELNWEDYGGKHHESIYTKFVQSYYLPEKFKIDYRRATYSTQICAGEITREHAIEELKKLSFDATKINEELVYVAKKFDLSIDEFKQILNLPPKRYYIYPNDKKWLEFVYQTYKNLINFSYKILCV